MTDLEKILMVDDESNVLAGYQRQLRGRVALTTALSGIEGLKEMKAHGPYAVVVSDYKMPAMDGVEFLSQTRRIFPDSVRMMLTGHADFQTAIEAVNRGHIFRLLIKPCSVEDLLLAIEAGIEQYRLVHAERDLLEKTLSSSVKVLTEMLSMANPIAFSRASRIVPYVRHVVNQLDLPDKWEFELAAMLSQIGCISLPPDVLGKVNRGEPLDDVEHKAYSTHPEIGYDLINNIPRLGNIAKIIRAQREPFNRSSEGSSLKDEDRAALGGHILKTALDFDQLLVRGLPTNVLTRRLGIMAGDETPEILAALADYESRMERKVTKKLRVDDLDRRMVLDEDVFATDGLLLASKGQAISFPMLARLRNFAAGIGVVQPIKVIVPSLKKKKTAPAPVG